MGVALSWSQGPSVELLKAGAMCIHYGQDGIARSPLMLGPDWLTGSCRERHSPLASIPSSASCICREREDPALPPIVPSFYLLAP